MHIFCRLPFNGFYHFRVLVANIWNAKTRNKVKIFLPIYIILVFPFAFTISRPIGEKEVCAKC